MHFDPVAAADAAQADTATAPCAAGAAERADAEKQLKSAPIRAAAKKAQAKSYREAVGAFERDPQYAPRRCDEPDASFWCVLGTMKDDLPFILDAAGFLLPSPVWDVYLFGVSRTLGGAQKLAERVDDERPLIKWRGPCVARLRVRGTPGPGRALHMVVDYNPPPTPTDTKETSSRSTSTSADAKEMSSGAAKQDRRTVHAALWWLPAAHPLNWPSYRVAETEHFMVAHFPINLASDLETFHEEGI